MARLVLSCGLLSSWLVLLLMGWSLGGAVHLLLLAALAIFPWRQLRVDAEEPSATETVDAAVDREVSGESPGSPSR